MNRKTKSTLFWFMLVATACVGKEPIDEEDVDPAINPPYTYVGDDGENTEDGNKMPLSYPNFNYSANPLAFPGAEGHGRFATGARGVKGAISVHKVTNLNASGPGSLTDALSQPNRIVVFDVAGVIDLNKGKAVFKSNQTVLFQTAPGDGIEIYNGSTSSSGASNLIVRYMRVRVGRQASGSDNIDCGGVANGENQIYDHCSFAWGLDENFSINPDGKGTSPRNITLQNSIVGQGCQNHSCGGLIQTSNQEGITFFRNLIIDNKTRNFKVKGLNQFVNNVVYNWGNGTGYNMGGESVQDSDTQIENNYFIKGPAVNWQNYGAENLPAGTDINDPTTCSPSGTGYYEVRTIVNPAPPISGGAKEFKTYLVGNYYDKDKDGTLNGYEITQANFLDDCSGSPTFLTSPNPAHPAIVGMKSAAEAYQYIVEKVGASLPRRDHVDNYMIEELTSLGTKGTIFRDQRKPEQYPLANTWQNINISAPKLDTDGDGIPDEFEDKWQLNKNDKSDAVVIAKNGYTNIENYVLSLEFPELYETAYNDYINQ